MDIEKVKICSACKEDITGLRKCPYCGKINDEDLITVNDLSVYENEDRLQGQLDDENEQNNAEIDIELNNNYVDLEENIIEEDFMQGIEEKNVDKANDNHDTIFGINENSTENKTKSINKERMSNSKKALICAISFAIPAFGQIIGIIISIFLMGNYNEDKKSFGKALMKYCIIVFFFVFILYCLLVLLILMYIRVFTG